MGVIAAILLWYGLRAVEIAHGSDAMLRQYFDIPEWLLLLFLPFGWTLVLIECLRRCWRATRDIRIA